MGITHEWNGTILTITSDSGTSSADLKGAKGDDGARGAQGAAGLVDYSLVYTKATPPTAAEVGAITEDELQAAIDGVEVDLSDYYTKNEVDTLTSGLASEEFVAQKIAEAQLDGEDIDLSAYYTKGETDLAIETAINGIQTEDVDLSNYYTKAEVDNLIPEETDLSNYYTKAQTDSAINAAIGDIETGGGKAVAYNHLDNSYWELKTKIINQRGSTSYSASAYTIDRWKYTNANGKLTLNDGYITLTAATSNSHWRQVLENSLNSSKDYTLAIKVKGSGGGYLGIYNSDATGSALEGATFTASSDWSIVLINISNVSNANLITIRCDAGATLNLEWAALYEGNYTVNTLPEYIYKGYAVEKAECMRYYQQYNSGDINTIGTSMSGYDYYRITLDTEMRVAPTLEATATFDSHYHGTGSYAGIVASMFDAKTKRIVLRGTAKQTFDAPQLIMGANTSAVKLSADL